MESNCKNRRRRNISKKRLIGFLIKNILLVIIISFFVIFIVNYRLKKSLKIYIGIEVDMVVSHVLCYELMEYVFVLMMKYCWIWLWCFIE